MFVLFAVSGADIRVRIRGIVVVVRIREAAIRAVVRVTAQIRHVAPSALIVVFAFVEVILVSVVAQCYTVWESIALPQFVERVFYPL